MSTRTTPLQFWLFVALLLAVAAASACDKSTRPPGGTCKNPLNCAGGGGPTTTSHTGGGSAGGSSASDIEWLRNFGDVAQQRGSRVAVDKQGNVIVTGFFQGTLKIDDEELTAAADMKADIFVAKLDPDGALVWAMSLGEAREPGVQLWDVVALAVEGDGDIVLAGEVQSQIKVGEVDIVNDNPVAPDLYVVKLTKDGLYKWHSHYTTGAMGAVRGVGIDGAGAIYVAGDYEDKVDFQDGMHEVTADTGVFLAKLAGGDGKIDWAVTHGQGASLTVSDMKVDAAGNCAIVGSFRGEMTFEGEKLVADALVNSAFAFKVGPDGKGVFAKVYPATAATVAYGTDVDGDRLWLAGQFAGDFDPDDGEGPRQGAAQGSMFVLELDAAGATTWARTASNSAGFDLTVRGDELYVGGSFRELFDLGGVNHKVKGNENLFVAKLDAADGTVDWVQALGDTGHVTVHALAIGPKGQIALAGGLAGKLVIDEGTLESVPIGQYDVLVGLLAP